MMKRLPMFFAAILTSFFAARAAHAQQPKVIFYMTREPQSVHSFLAHADKIDILSPNWYSMDSSGLVSGGPNPQVLETARQRHVPIMPLVVNGGVAQERKHKVFLYASARQEAIARFVRASQNNRYSRFPFGLEKR